MSDREGIESLISELERMREELVTLADQIRKSIGASHLDSTKMRPLRGPKTYAMCSIESCHNGVPYSRRKTGLCLECLDKHVSDLNEEE